MGKSTEKFAAVRKKLNEAKQELRTTGEKAIREALLEFFNEYPQVLAIRWKQYTPYFNDGDECTFNVHEPCILLEGVSDGGDYDDGFLGGYDLDSVVPADRKEEWMKLCYPPNGEQYDKKTGRSNYSSEGGRQADKFKTWAPGASKVLKEDLSELNSLLCVSTEILRSALGDHAEVTATRENIKVKKYEHE